MNAIVFYLVLSLPGHAPVTHNHLATDLAECLTDVREALSRVGPTMAVAGGHLQAGCVVSLAPALEVDHQHEDR